VKCFHPGEFINTIQNAIESLRNGHFILIYDNDSRESETDLVLAAQFITPEAIKRMRKDGGGLIFLMVSNPAAKKLQLPFLSDLFSAVSAQYPVLKALVPNDIPYDTKSSFSLYINHRKTFTGITDNDRSFTMKKFAELEKVIRS
jgi:3,4-dihydroxy 2-butanone 4-phosphate synthase